jgi:hypothetical protein
MMPNRLDVTKGWNVLMRVYRSGATVLAEFFKLPKALTIK